MKYFSISEMLKSEKAIKAMVWNGASVADEERLRLLVEKVLDPLREKWGRPITVNSGYRSETVNRMVGGVPSSQHRIGEAADITAGSPEDNRLLAAMLVASGLPYDQLINECGWAWVHVSYTEQRQNRRQLLRYDGKRYYEMKLEEI